MQVSGVGHLSSDFATSGPWTFASASQALVAENTALRNFSQLLAARLEVYVSAGPVLPFLLVVQEGSHKEAHHFEGSNLMH